MTRIDFHQVNFEKMKIVDNYEYHSEDYHAYHLEFQISEFPKEKFLITIDVWGDDWSLKPIYQMHKKTKYMLDDELKERFITAFKKIK